MNSIQESVDFWTQFPSYHPFRIPPEDASILLPYSPTVNRTDPLPSNLDKGNPSFHVVLPATRGTPGLCRLLTSAMILNYPPPTFVGYGKSLPEGATDHDALVERVRGIYNHLASSSHVHDDDFVLILDGSDYFFQLPPEVMIQRFQSLLRERNAKLRKKYGVAMVDSSSRSDASPEIIQKYSQRVLFSASKTCNLLNMTLDPGCVTVPRSALPPDVYGWDTDLGIHVDMNRPRWLNPGTVMGQVADLKPIYAQVLAFVEQQKHNKTSEHLALTQMYGRQEYVRELERRRSSNAFMEWLYRRIGISDASNISGAEEPQLKPGWRYEYGIGVDSESRIFFDMLHSHRDLEWLNFDNVTTTSAAQMAHGVPRERRLLLPADLHDGRIANPFFHPNSTKNEAINPPYNHTLDDLPSPRNHSYHNIPLLTNVRSDTVPALIHVDGDRLAQDGFWLKMWYQPWARALLRKYMRTPLGFDAAQSALLGGQEWWDMRGGKGGIWTDQGQWLGYPEVCRGFERDVFEDGKGPWGKEDGSEEGPVFNQFGSVIKES